jgi:hypothetical protein
MGITTLPKSDPPAADKLRFSNITKAFIVLIIIVAFGFYNDTKSLNTLLSDLEDQSSTQDEAKVEPLRLLSEDVFNDTLIETPGYYTCRINSTETVTLPILLDLIIVGAQKGGTTALYNILRMVPGVVASKRTEPHFFDWHVPKDAYKLSSEKLCQLNKQYAGYFDTQKLLNATIAFEKTPIYIALRKVPANIKTLLSLVPIHTTK